MSHFSNFLFYASYAMIAFVIGASAAQFAETSFGLSVLIGVAVFLMLSQVHALINRTQERAAFERELATLQRTQQIVTKELERTSARMRELAEISEAKASARNDQLISEVRVLETLVKQVSHQPPRQTTKPLPDPTAIPPKSVRSPADLQEVFGQISEDELLDVVQGALDDNRVDIYLQPIVSLPQRKVRFYEGFSRLRTVDGGVIEPSQYLTLAESTGRISLIDNLLLFRCVQIVRRLAMREKDLAIFCNISGHSLRDQDFFPQFLDFMKANRNLAQHLIFEFGQYTVETCTPTEKTNLRRLAELGFRFSMDKVQDLDLNLAELRDRHFRFIKIEPDVLRSALPENERMVWAEPRDLDNDGEVIEEHTALEEADPLTEPIDDVSVLVDDEPWGHTHHADHSIAKPPIHAADFKALLNRFKLDLIVEKIETEHDVIEMVELDVDFGQGYLFGEPRPVRDSDMDEDVPGWQKLERHDDDLEALAV